MTAWTKFQKHSGSRNSASRLQANIQLIWQDMLGRECHLHCFVARMALLLMTWLLLCHQQVLVCRCSTCQGQMGQLMQPYWAIALVILQCHAAITSRLQHNVFGSERTAVTVSARSVPSSSASLPGRHGSMAPFLCLTIDDPADHCAIAIVRSGSWR